MRHLDHWYMPLLFMIVLPVITIPASSLIQGQLCAGFPVAGIGEDLRKACPTPLVVAALAPGLIGIMSLLWLRSRSKDVRAAAIVAASLALLRVIGPAVHLLTSGPVQYVGGAPWGLGWSFVSLALWYMTILALASHQNWPTRITAGNQHRMNSN
jgi:hypothetical protein